MNMGLLFSKKKANFEQYPLQAPRQISAEYLGSCLAREFCLICLGLHGLPLGFFPKL